MLVIGEKINASNKAVGEAILNRDADFIVELAKAQDTAGADFIDVNAGNGNNDVSGVESMKWLVNTIKAATEKPLAIDSDDPEIIEAGISVYGDGDLLINSVTAEFDRLNTIGPFAAQRNASLVALAMGAEGIPDNVKDRLDACETILNTLSGMGIEENNVYFDPLVLPVSVDSQQGKVTLDTIKEIKRRYPETNTVVGLSNISYGLPNRKLVNRAFLLMAAQAGLDAAIMDPLDKKMMSMKSIINLLSGKESSARAYMRAHRSGRIVD
ncbi:MAG: dihydropteroate synthase [Dehalococcoidales bacterium]|nr:MAG: dihydropteroate synthase [Dehalococcoidales bacterium]